MVLACAASTVIMELGNVRLQLTTLPAGPVVVPTVRLGSGSSSTACVRTLRRSVAALYRGPAGATRLAGRPLDPVQLASLPGWSPVHFPDRPVRYTVCGGGIILHAW